MYTSCVILIHKDSPLIEGSGNSLDCASSAIDLVLE